MVIRRFTKERRSYTKTTKKLIRGELKVNFGPLSKEITGATIEVHKVLGSGLLESAYEEYLTHERKQKGLKVERQVPVQIE